MTGQLPGQEILRRRRHSVLGIVSGVLATLNIFTLCLMTSIVLGLATEFAVTWNRNPEEILSRDPTVTRIMTNSQRLCSSVSPVIALVALALGIFALTQRGRTKLFAIIGTVLSIIALLLSCGVLGCMNRP